MRPDYSPEWRLTPQQYRIFRVLRSIYPEGMEPEFLIERFGDAAPMQVTEIRKRLTGWDIAFAQHGGYRLVEAPEKAARKIFPKPPPTPPTVRQRTREAVRDVLRMWGERLARQRMEDRE